MLFSLCPCRCCSLTSIPCSLTVAHITYHSCHLVITTFYSTNDNCRLHCWHDMSMSPKPPCNSPWLKAPPQKPIQIFQVTVIACWHPRPMHKETHFLLDFFTMGSSIHIWVSWVVIMTNYCVTISCRIWRLHDKHTSNTTFAWHPTCLPHTILAIIDVVQVLDIRAPINSSAIIVSLQRWTSSLGVIPHQQSNLNIHGNCSHSNSCYSTPCSVHTCIQ